MRHDDVVKTSKWADGVVKPDREEHFRRWSSEYRDCQRGLVRIDRGEARNKSSTAAVVER